MGIKAKDVKLKKSKKKKMRSETKGEKGQRDVPEGVKKKEEEEDKKIS